MRCALARSGSEVNAAVISADALAGWSAENETEHRTKPAASNAGSPALATEVLRSL